MEQDSKASRKTAAIPPLAVLVCGLLFLLVTTQTGRTQANDSGSQPAAQQNSDGSGGIRLPAPKGKKLILKDGTYQIAREYSVEGDRVRYWSVERAEWEEIPSDLVDWDATKKAEAEQQREEQALDEKIRETRRAEETAGVDEVDASMEVKPGLFLPDGFGMFALENRQILPMKQDQAVSKIDLGREAERTLAGIPAIASKWRIELPGKHADIRLSTQDPEFWMRTADQREPRLVLIQAKIKGSSRFLESESNSEALGTHSYKADEYAFESWQMAPGVYRFTMNQKLPPGEYAFLEMTADGTNLYVWDFGVDQPSADTNPSTPSKP
ncbi:MAG: hypothetical protein ACLP1Y_11245 [Candidatus Acidiferrales bacterium]